MKLKYTIQNDINHYVVAQVSLATKIASIQYVENGAIVMENFQTVASILDADPTVHPQIQVFKKGRFWDLVVWKTDTLGNTMKAIIPLELPGDFTATELKIINNETVDITIQDYLTKTLTTYDRSESILTETTEDSVTMRIPITQAVHTVVIDRGRMWTYRRNGSIWDIHYENPGTGEDFDLPAVPDENGIITHYDGPVEANRTFDYNITFKNQAGQVLDTKLVLAQTKPATPPPPTTNDLMTPTGIMWNESVDTNQEPILEITLDNVYLQDNRIVGYNIYIDGTRIDTFGIDQSAPTVSGSIPWNAYESGDHTLIVTSIDGAGGESVPSSPVTVTKA